MTGREIPNLYLMDSSMFPTSVGANPMQSLYTFAKIFSERLLKGMDEPAPMAFVALRTDRPTRGPALFTQRPRWTEAQSGHQKSGQHKKDCHRGFGLATVPRTLPGLAGGEVCGRHLSSHRATHGHLCR